MFDKLNIIITLIASIVVTVFCLFSDKTVAHSVFSIIITIIIFFVIGCVARHYAGKWFPKDTEEEEQIEEQEEIPS